MEVPRHWRLKAQRYRMEGSACRACGQMTFPPRPICPDCAALLSSSRAVLNIPQPSSVWQAIPVRPENIQKVPQTVPLTPGS